MSETITMKAFRLLLMGLLGFFANSSSNLVAQEELVPQGILLTPKAFRAAVEKIRPAMVMIETSGSTQTATKGITRTEPGPSTGVMISDDGYIITSTFNFIQKPTAIRVIFADGSQQLAKLMGQDHARKLCLLKVEKHPKIAVPEIVSHKALHVGQWAIALGFGLGAKSPAISRGIISAKERIGGLAIQTDANISPTNYGGPLVDIHGKLIGICVPLHPASKDAASGVDWYDSGIGFAIPLDGAEKRLQSMKKADALISLPQLGVQLQPTPDVDNPDKPGIKILRVAPNSAAAKAELTPNDLILGIDGTKVQNRGELQALINQYQPGDTIQVEIERENETFELEVTLGAASGKIVPPLNPQPLPQPFPEAQPFPRPKLPTR